MNLRGEPHVKVVIAAAIALLATPVYGSSCNHEIVVPIKFRGGSYEWVHRGVGTHFFGNFIKGQSISVASAAGTGYDTRGDLSWTRTKDDPWQVYISGPGGFSQLGDFDNGTLFVKIPATGKYVIQIGPCAVWGAPGTVLVHASDPRLTTE
jgi:hypothetical protein